MAVPVQELLTQGRAALRAGDAAAARLAFESAVAGGGCGAAIEGLARVRYLELDFAGAIEDWTRAYAAYRAERDQVGAVRVARTLAGMYGTVVGDWAVGSGWLARAQTLLGEAPDADEVPQSSERGWVALDVGMFTSDRAAKERRFREALAVARRVGDTDLEFVALAYLGASLVHADRTDEGMALLDEALAAVSGAEVDDFAVLEEIFCQLFSACEHAYDVARADQWIRVGEAIAERRKLPAVSAFCRTHYGAVLTAAGRWREADAALTEAVRMWDVGQRSGLRGGALVRLAELRVRQGRFEEAAQLLAGVDVDAEPAAARPLAAIHLSRGDASLACDVLERALAVVDPTSTGAAPLLAQLVDVHLAAGRPDQAAVTAQRLQDHVAGHPGEYLRALAALARGRVCLVAGTDDPRACLREAIVCFVRARMPVDAAEARLELAAALAADQPEVATAEARAALAVFDKSRAGRDLAATAALLRSLGVRPSTAPQPGGLLTRREAEVLELLGHGLSNPEISDRLYISRKTVEHHVGNILAKLGLRSRAEAAAYAARTRPGQE
ncbi:MAG TPA: LuxR C-terminal-related transcriptional regulator [Micromonosporaceae bacterium]